MKLATILGTRPEIIKLSPLIPLLDEKFEHVLVHTGQHFDWSMDKSFFEDLHLREPDYNLEVGSLDTFQQVLKMTDKITKLFEKEKPNYVIVYGDTNSTLAGAISAKKLGIPIVHVEAGSRSKNPEQPEEQNRIIVDHLSSYFFTINEEDKQNLIDENIKDNIFVTGNLLYDAVKINSGKSLGSNILEKLDVKSNDYLLVTCHRAETVDDKENLSQIVETLNKLANDNKIILPLHPHTKKSLKKFNLKLEEDVILPEPLTYLDFLRLINDSKLVLTDSGGVLEESIIMKKPVIILREETEFPQFLEQGIAILAGVNENTYNIINNLLNDETKLSELKSGSREFYQDVANKIINHMENQLK